MTATINRTSLPISDPFALPALLEVEPDNGYDALLSALFSINFQGPLPDLPGEVVDVLLPVAIIPQVAATLSNLVQVVHDCFEIGAQLEIINQLECICQNMQAMAPARILRVSVDSFPDNTDVISGQGGGPDTLFPVGWVNFSTPDGFFQREFINHPIQLVAIENNDPLLEFHLYQKPNVLMSANWL